MHIVCDSLTVGGTTTPTPPSSAFTATLTSSISNLTVLGTLTVSALYNSVQSAANQGVFALSSGSVSVDKVDFVTVPIFGPTLTLAAGSENGTLTLAQAVPFTVSGGGSHTFTANGSNATVVYSGTAQAVKATAYRHLVLADSGVKTNTGVTVNGVLSMQGTATCTAAPVYGTNATLEYKGSAAQTSGPELTGFLPGLAVNNTAGVTLTNNTTVSNMLSLVSGRVITGVKQINLAAGASVSGGSAASYVSGNLQKTFSTGSQTHTFHIGDIFSYTPLTLSNLSVTTSGSIKVSTTIDDHPQAATSGIDAALSVNRYWTLTQSGGTFGTYAVIFNYSAADIDAGAAASQFAAAAWNGSSWSFASVSGTPTTSVTVITGQSQFGDFFIGEPVSIPVIWSGVGGADKNWSTATNWLGGATPGTFDDVFFHNYGAVATASNINNIVNAGFPGAVGSLKYAHSNNFHTTLINPGVALTANSGFGVGTETFVSATQTVSATITGNGGTLSLDLPDTSIVMIRQGVASGTATPGTPTAVLDLSGLGTFVAAAQRIVVGVESAAIRRAGGLLYLARTNLISVSGLPSAGVTHGGGPAVYIGHNTQSGNQNPAGAAIYLGITNAIFGDYFVIGRGNQTNNVLAFNPAFLVHNPAARFRSLDGVNRVGVWTIGDNSASGGISSPSSGLCDFTGGRVDALVGLMFVGRGALNNHGTANSPGIGTLTFNNGTIDVNTLYLGYQNLGTNYSSSGIGTVNVNGTNATLVVNTLEFGHATNTSLVSPSGTLNISGGQVLANTIFVGGGTGIIAMINGTLAVSNTAGTPSVPLTSLRLTNSTLQYSIAGAITNSVITTLTTGGATNRISIASLPVIMGYPTQFTLLKYSGSIGGAGFNIGLASLPPGAKGYVSNHTASSTVVLVLTPTPARLAITSVNGGSAPVAGTPFNVVVQSQDNSGIPRNVAVDTAVTLSLNTGSGTPGGTVAGTIPAGTNTVTITGVTYTKAESGIVLTASRTSGEPLTAGNSSPFTVNPGAVSAAQSTVAATPASVAADDVSSSTITVTLKDAHNNPVSGKTVTLAKNGGSSTISIASGPSDTNGAVTFSVKNQVLETTIYSATDTSDALPITQTATVTFIAVPWHNPAWSYRKPIAIDHTKVAGDLTNFPVLIHFTGSDLSAHALTNGFDLLFTSSDGTNKLAHQIERFTSSNGVLIAWVNVPNLSSAIDTVLYLYYGNPAATNQQNAAGVWDSNFKAVWHLEEVGNGTVGEYKDATSNTNNAQGGGGIAGSVPARTGGKIGNSQSCDGTNDYIVSVNKVGIGGAAVRTVSFWVNLNTTNRTGIVGWGSNAPDAEFEAGVRSGSLHLWGYGSGNDWSVLLPPQTNSWHYHAVTFDGAVARWFVDGSSAGAFTNTYATTNGPVFIGYQNDNGSQYYMGGAVDEVRVAGTARSAAWIATEYQNQNSPATFHTIGTQQGNQTITFPSPGNQTYGVAPITLTATASSGLTVSYSVLSGPASVSNDSLTITGAGSITIQASQAGNSNWNPAPNTNQTILVAPKTVTAGITVSNKVYDGTVVASIASRSLTGVINGDAVNLIGGTANFADKNVGSGKTVIATGLALAGAQAGSYTLASTSATNTASITPASLTVTADDQSRPYGATNPLFTASYNGFVAGEGMEVLSGSPDLSTTAVVDSPVGNYPIDVSAGTLSAPNYNLSFVAGTLAVLERPVIVIAINRVGVTNQVTLTITGAVPGVMYHIEAAPNLVDWTEVGSQPATPEGSLLFNDSSTAPVRHYRAFRN